MRKTRKFSFVAALTAAVALVLSGFAVADTMHSVDGSTTLSGHDIQYNSGGTGNNFACSARGTAVAGAGVIRKKSEGPSFANSAELSITATSTQAGITVTPTTTTLPSGWASAANNAEHTFSFSTTVSTAVGTGTYAVTLKAEGMLAGGGSGYVEGTFDVVLVDCAAAGDTTLPTNVSITINSGANWTNNATVSLALAATDNVGITRYRLAESQGGLVTASDVAVSPAEPSFGRSAQSFTLTGGDGSAKAVWMRVFDAAGNSVDSSDTIGLDTVKPTITGSTGTYVRGTWTNQSVVVGFTCADSTGGSGIATDTLAGTTLTGSGADQQVTSTGVCTDSAGNSADAVTVTDIDIDKLAPTSVVTGVTEGAVYASPPIGCSATDQVGLSGVATQGSVTGATTTPGAKSVTCNGATDNAGNTQTTASAAVNYTLAPIGGFNTNFDGNAVLKVKPNQAIPLKWAFSDGTTNHALLTATGGSIASVSSTRCDAGGVDGTETAVSEGVAGQSGLQLLPDNSYQMNWKAPSTPVGCRALTVTMTFTAGGTASRTILVNVTK